MIMPLAAAFSSTVRAEVKAATGEQHAEARVLVMSRGRLRGDLLAEADRRARLYEEAWRSRVAAPPRGYSPRRAGLESVAEDLARGFL